MALPGCAGGAERPLARRVELPEGPYGALRLLGGLEIDRGVLGFGGLSGLHLAPDLLLTAISDRARFVEMRLALDGDSRPTGLTLIRSGWLRDERGRAMPPGRAADAEALARLPDGTWLVGFERRHRIAAYASWTGPARAMPAPPGLEASPANAALESLAVLADGRWLALSEGLPWGAGAAGDRRGWIGGPAAWHAFGYRPAPGHVPVDAAALPDGGALVLERAFGLLAGFSGRLVHLPPAALREAGEGALVQGEDVLRLDPPLPFDNYEGVAVLDRAGRRLVALVSDDNESPWQRSLLLLFEWPG
ncbi:esterase-like activity of phytase family protein [Falsiroseomonas sp.]|uniref:esterase-like activity of phytase family protein n=1 Tax=Falsiroseomonas sp. TaxID=2870721 RepID=UPI003F7285C3